MSDLASVRMPAVFFGHGSPMNALEVNRYTEAWRAFGQSIPKPRAILAISAHWYVPATAVTAMPQPRTIHDFGGFPEALFELQYPAAGDPVLADEVAELLAPTPVVLDREAWGLDHGTWSVLVHAFPAADVPVIQLAIDARQDFDFHLQLGSKLAPLRDHGVLIVGSGNVVHNLRALNRDMPDAAFDWAERFDEVVRQTLQNEPSAVAELGAHPDFARSAPTPEHFIPLLYIAGLAAADGGGDVRTLVHGYALGSLSMASYSVGAAAV